MVVSECSVSICPVLPLIGEHVVHSVSLYNYLICFLSISQFLLVTVPSPYLILYISVIQLQY